MSATSPITIDAINPPKPLQDKYDKRKPQRRGPYKKRTQTLNGPQPQWMKHFTRNSVFAVLRAINDVESWPQLFQWAVQEEDRRLCFDILCYLTDKRDGKAFVAINPAAIAPTGKVVDNRTQVAINTLLVGGAKPSLPSGDPALSQSAVLATVGLDATATSNNVTSTMTPDAPGRSKRPRRAGGAR